MGKYKLLSSRFVAAVLAITLAAGMGTTAVSAAGGYWNETEDGWRYLESNGNPVVKRFANIDGHWYNFDENGIMTSW